MESTSLKELKNNKCQLNRSNILEENNPDLKIDLNGLEVTESSIYLDEDIRAKLTKLPLGRIRTIIKTDVEINLINQEAVFLITKATELFIGALAKESYKYTHQSTKKTVQKYDVQNAIDNVNTLIFLDGI